jgi:hypothetical protein
MTYRHRPTSETQDGGRQTGRTRISRSIIDKREIRNAIFQVFHVGQTDKLKSDTRRHRLTPETKDGGRQTGSTRSSRSIIDKCEIRNVISKFSMSARPTNSSPTPADTGNERWRPPNRKYLYLAFYRR